MEGHPPSFLKCLIKERSTKSVDVVMGGQAPRKRNSINSMRYINVDSGFLQSSTYRKLY